MLSFFKSLGKSVAQLLTGGILACLLLLLITSQEKSSGLVDHIDQPSLPLLPESQFYYATGAISLDYFKAKYEQTDKLLRRMHTQKQFKLNAEERSFLKKIRDYQEELQKYLDDLVDNIQTDLLQVYSHAAYKPTDHVAGLPLENEEIGHYLFYYRRSSTTLLNEIYRFSRDLRSFVSKKEGSVIMYYEPYPPAPAFFDYNTLGVFFQKKSAVNSYLISNYFMNCTVIEGIALLNLIHHQSYYDLCRLQSYLVLNHIAPYENRAAPRSMTLDLTEDGEVKKQRLYNLFPLETPLPLKVRWEKQQLKALSVDKPLAIPFKENGRLWVELDDPYFRVNTNLLLQRSEQNGSILK